MTPDLSMVAIEDLIDEMLSRVDHGVVSLYREMSDQGDFGILRRWDGNLMTCVGLSCGLATAIDRHIESLGVDDCVDDF
jgi:hypothetical protein